VSEPVQRRALPQQAEVVIIGGGFAGAATAYYLTQLGIGDVVLLEREATCGYHASGRNAALGRQITEHEEFTELTVQGAEFLRGPPDDFSAHRLLSQCGSIILVDSVEQAQRLMDTASRFDVPCALASSTSLAQHWPRLSATPAASGVLFPSDGVIDVHALLQGFLAGARRGGARVLTRCAVEGFRRNGRRRVQVQTEHGTVDTQCVVMAAGAWAGPLGSLAAGRSVPFTPIQRHLFTTDAVTISADAPFVWHIGATEFYVRPEGTGLLVSGCDESPSEPCDAVVAAGAVEQLADRLDAAAPGLSDIGIARAWACLRTFNPGGGPEVDWDDEVPWLFWVAGLGGHGATASAAVGQRAANRIAIRRGIRMAGSA